MEGGVQGINQDKKNCRNCHEVPDKLPTGAPDVYRNASFVKNVFCCLDYYNLKKSYSYDSLKIRLQPILAKGIHINKKTVKGKFRIYHQYILYSKCKKGDKKN